MPESYVDSMATSKSVLIRHLLPTLQQKITWPEKQRTIILTGTRGEVPFLHKAPKEPMMDAVSRGSLIMGFELHKSLGLKVGDKTEVMNRSFTILKCNESRGNIDDITIWVNLEESQEMLNKEGQINAILALKCHCNANELAEVRKEVNAILPGTQVYEKGSKILVRAEARDRAAKEAEEAINAEITHRENLRSENENFTSILLPLVLLSSVIWIVFLFIGNVRERKSEIGILRAIGVKESSIMQLFFQKAFIMGIVGAFLGYLIGIGAGVVWSGIFSNSFFSFNLLLAVLVVAPLLSLAAAYIPATIAARQDPAEVLKEE
jgi:putative ABC transport system permease protein